jgi:hypothetical protein
VSVCQCGDGDSVGDDRVELMVGWIRISG